VNVRLFTILTASKKDITDIQESSEENCSDTACAVKAGNAVGSDGAVIGTVYAKGQSFSISLRLIRVSDGEEILRIETPYAGPMDLQKELEKAAERFRKVQGSFKETSNASSGTQDTYDEYYAQDDSYEKEKATGSVSLNFSSIINQYNDLGSTNAAYEYSKSSSLPGIDASINIPLGNLSYLSIEESFEYSLNNYYYNNAGLSFTKNFSSGSGITVFLQNEINKNISSDDDTNSYSSVNDSYYSLSPGIRAYLVNGPLSLSFDVYSLYTKYTYTKTESDLSDSLSPSISVGLELMPDKYNQLSVSGTAVLEALNSTGERMNDFIAETFDAALGIYYTHNFLLGGNISIGLDANYYNTWAYENENYLMTDLSHDMELEIGFDHIFSYNLDISRTWTTPGFLDNSENNNKTELTFNPEFEFNITKKVRFIIDTQAAITYSDSVSNKENDTFDIDISLNPVITIPKKARVSVSLPVLPYTYYYRYDLPDQITNEIIVSGSNTVTNTAGDLPEHSRTWNFGLGIDIYPGEFITIGYDGSIDITTYAYSDSSIEGKKYNGQMFDSWTTSHSLQVSLIFTKQFYIDLNGGVTLRKSVDGTSDGLDIEGSISPRYTF
jgi:hypothetical protein